MDNKLDKETKIAYDNYKDSSCSQNFLSYRRFLLINFTIGILGLCLSWKKTYFHIGFLFILILCFIIIFTTGLVLEKRLIKGFEKISGIIVYIFIAILSWHVLYFMAIDLSAQTEVFASHMTQFYNIIALVFVQNLKVQMLLQAYLRAGVIILKYILGEPITSLIIIDNFLI